jgi:hypothetical protein
MPGARWTPSSTATAGTVPRGPRGNPGHEPQVAPSLAASAATGWGILTDRYDRPLTTMVGVRARDHAGLQRVGAHHAGADQLRGEPVGRPRSFGRCTVTGPAVVFTVVGQ